MDLGLKGKKAIVTGATKGIGRRIANLLADEGADVAVCARHDGEVKETLAALSAKGVTATGGVVSVADGPAYKAWLQQAAETLGGCDIFIPNVSAGGGLGGEEFWQNAFDVDMMGAVRGVEVLTPYLKKSGHGAVVLIASTNAVEFFLGPMAYNAMKAALVNYGKQLALATAADGIRVNTVSPGPIYFPGGAWATIEQHMPEFYREALAKMPRGVMGTPEEVANVVVFVASPAASLMVGANVVVDGGFTKRVQF